MKPRLIVSGWHGTIIDDLDDEAVFREISYGELVDSAKRFDLKRAGAVLRARRQLIEGFRQYRDGKHDPESRQEQMGKILESFNVEILEGTPMDRIEKHLVEYGAEARKRLSSPIINAIAYYRHMNDDEMSSAILSSGYHGGILAALGITFAQYFEPIYASTLESDGHGKAKGIRLEYNDNDEKIKILMGFIRDNGCEPEDVVFIGGGFGDEIYAEHVGRFVVSPYAAPEFKRDITDMVCKYGDKVWWPENENRAIIHALKPVKLT